MKGMLIDTAKCVACRSCQVACKEWNELEAEETEFFGGSGYQNPADLSTKTWTLIEFHDDMRKGSYNDWIFSKKQCMHCIDPACVAACPEEAMIKRRDGTVIYNTENCTGCQECSLACPFNIPRFSEDNDDEIRKCHLCYDRIDAGMLPACAKTCTTGAIKFGKRETLLREAENRISESPGIYVDHIYGKTEVGGTCVIYLASVPFSELGFRTDLPDTPVVASVNSALKSIPYAMLGPGLVLGGINWIINRRIENENSGKSTE